jgi:hypothetical protein
MLRHGLRLGVAILTFSIGIAIFWPLKIIQRLETVLVDRFYDYDLKPVNVSFDPANETNEIYRLLIHERFTPNGEAKLIVLRSETIAFAPFKDESLEPDWNPATFVKTVKNSLPEAESQTLDNYLLRNESPEQLRVWNPGINYVLVTNRELPTSATNFWDEFYKKFPHSSGIVSFSSVGFNDQHDQAFVYAARSCGGLCGAGDFVLLKKVNGEWKIVGEECLWVS